MERKRYIKCSHCRKLVPVHSEYMVMCPFCNKKLDNSFVEWQKKNPGASYQSYLLETTISQAAIEGLGDQKRITRKVGMKQNMNRWIASLALAVVVVVLVVTGVFLYEKIQSGASIKSILNDNWRISYYEDLGATVKFPFTLDLQEGIVADSTAVADSTQVIIGAVSRTWSREGVAAISATRVDFMPDYGVDREVATQEILQAIVQENEMRAFEFVPSDYSMGQAGKARMMTGSYLVGAEANEFRAIMIIRGDTVWYFMVAFPRSMPEGILLADKFFNGILL